MIFLYFTFLLSRATSQIEHLSLAPPYVDTKGVSSLVDIHNEYSILSYGGDKYIQLGYSAPNTSGYMIYKNTIADTSFAVDFIFSLSNHRNNPGKGLLLFLSTTNKYESGAFYGIKQVNGLSIIIDTSRLYKPYVSVQLNDKSTKQYPIDIYDGDKISIRIVQDNSKLQVILMEEYDELKVLYESKILLPNNLYIGASAANGPVGKTSYQIRSIQASKVRHVPVYFEKGEREGNSRIVWIVFLLSFVGISYYLYSVHLGKNK